NLPPSGVSRAHTGLFLRIHRVFPVAAASVAHPALHVSYFVRILEHTRSPFPCAGTTSPPNVPSVSREPRGEPTSRSARSEWAIGGSAGESETGVASTARHACEDDLRKNPMSSSTRSAPTAKVSARSLLIDRTTRRRSADVSRKVRSFCVSASSSVDLRVIVRAHFLAVVRARRARLTCRRSPLR